MIYPDWSIAHTVLEEEELNLLVEQIPKTMKTEFTSLADRLREKGREEGMDIERERKNRAATENMLRKEYMLSEICDILDVTPEFVEKVRKEMVDLSKN